MNIFLTFFMAFFCLVVADAAYAQQVDLILPPGIAIGEPFYKDAHVKIDDQLYPVSEGPLPDGQLAAFDPEIKHVVISNGSATEQEKGQALMQVLSALQAGAVAPAAGGP